MDQVQQHPLGGGFIGVGMFSCSEKICGRRIDSDGESDGDGIDHILYGIDQRQCGHGILAKFCYEVAVHDVV